jgi:two-component system NarL family sensor kinase
MASTGHRRTGVWLLAGFSLAASLAFFVYRVTAPSDGAVAAFYANAWQADGVVIQPIDQPLGGLRPGDVVRTVAGRSISDWIDHAADPSIDRSGLAAPGPIAYGITREGIAQDLPVSMGAHDVSSILIDNWSVLVFTLVFQGVAAYVLWRRPREPAAVALIVAACGVTGSTLPWLLGLQVSDLALGWPFLLHALTAGGIYMLLWPAGALHLPLAMTGGLTSRRLALAYGIPLGGYLAILIAARVGSPTASAWLGTWPVVQMIVVIPTVLVGLGLSIRGYRAATPAYRQQVRWAAGGGAASTIVSLGVLMVPELVLGRPLIPWSAVGLIALPLPLGIAVGILRYRLFDIDVVVNRALVYGGATLGLVATYAVSVSLLGAILPVGAGFPASLLATGIAAMVALPIRDVLQQGVNRVMYGDRDDPYRALARLGQRLEATLDPIEAPDVIVRTVAESLRLPWAALRLGPAGAPVRLIEHGRRPPGEPIAVPLVYGAEVVGDLLVASRSATEPLSAADRTLLEALARQAGAAVHALRLTLDLIASRERLVATREEERRRIRRDLHDGLGPTLAAIGMRAEVAADLVARDPDAAQRILDELRGEVHGALGDVRRLVDALRPPALDELGLMGALEAQAGRLGPPPVVDVAASGPLPELPAAVEVAAYRIAVEAMTNAARHARAKRCRVQLAEASGPDGESGVIDRALEVEVTDDGLGVAADAKPGIGLVSMRERAAEVGGTCVIESALGGGTRVFARLPLDGAVPAQPA